MKLSILVALLALSLTSCKFNEEKITLELEKAAALKECVTGCWQATYGEDAPEVIEVVVE
jgi:hypothetical protein